MQSLRTTLLADGPSDRALLPIIRWVLEQRLNNTALQPTEFADLRVLPRPPKGLSERIERSIDLFPCDLLFIHRDAEAEPHGNRIAEIQEAIKSIVPPLTVPYICVVPVRMQEAWMLFDEAAIRRAAGNPNGKVVLKLPNLASIEAIPDPKDVLNSLLISASELGSHRRQRFRCSIAAPLVAGYAESFSPLQGLAAFRAFEAEVDAFVATIDAT